MPGYQQRAEALRAEGRAAPANGASALAEELLHSWSMGLASAAAVQRIALAALLDGATHPEVVGLAMLGTAGAHAQNAQRDLFSRLNREVRLPEATLLEVPALDAKCHPPGVRATCPVLLPHLAVAALADGYGDELGPFFGLDRVPDFWSQLRGEDPRLEGNPVADIADRSRIVPIWIHGDGVEFSTDSLLAVSWGSVLSMSSSMDSSLLCAAWPKSATQSAKRGDPGDTWAPIWEVVCWSFTQLWHGVHPTRDWRGQPFGHGTLEARLAGRPIAGGWRPRP